MKKINKFFSVLLVAVWLLSVNSASITVAAENGIGTEALPYLITTAEDLQNINNDVTAHYKLAGNIDLQEMDFTPIGNADTGAFIGSFDGNGYTISNLSVFAGKYAGLFGYNEGTIKNVILSDAFVYGTRYVGAVAAYNSETGVIENCSVKSGDVECDGGLNTVSVGGICGENCGIMTGEFSNAADLTVKNTNLACAAGICAVNNGEFVGTFANSGNVYAEAVNDDAYAGGVIATTSTALDITATNSGDISSSSYAGGIGALFSESVKLTDCYNTGLIVGIANGNIDDDYPYYLGGIGGKFLQLAEFDACNNYGSVHLEVGNLERPFYIGGLGARFAANTKLNNCNNRGDIYGSEYFSNGWTSYGSSGYVGGLCGSVAGTIWVDNCTNVGLISSSSLHTYVGGLSGSVNSAFFTNCFNSGTITAQGGSTEVGGLIGRAGSDGIVELYNCYNTSVLVRSSYTYTSIYDYVAGLIGYKYSGNIFLRKCFNSGAITGGHQNAGLCCTESSVSVLAENCYNTGYSRGYNILGANFTCINCYTVDYIGEKIEGTNCYSSVYFLNKNAKSTAENVLTADEMRDKNSFKGWDFDTVWGIDPNINGGLPYLREACNPLSLNIVAHTMVLGEQLQLVAYKNGKPYTDVTWSSTQENTIDSKGVFTPVVTDSATIITAKDNEGHSVTASIRVLSPNTSVSRSDFSIPVNTKSSYVSVSFDQYDCLINVESSNPDILRIDRFYDSQFYCTSLSAGKVTITFTTAHGVVGSCVCTVTNVAQSIRLNTTNVSIPKDSTYQLTVTPDPNPTSSTYTWSSSDKTVATVDATGKVYGVNKGRATITCRTDNGLSQDCTVNVTLPITEIAFDEPEVTIYVGDSKELTLTVNPPDTTDTVSYSSSDRYDVSVSSSGRFSCTIYALYTGTETITATASNGLKATCRVNVLPVPVIVTGISLNSTSRSMLVGDMYKLNATVSPSNATDKTVVWTSTDETVATVSDTGYIEAVGPGETVITAAASNGVVSQCTVTVTDPANNQKPIIYIPDITVGDDEHIDILVMIENNPGINNAMFSVQYDKEKVEPVSVTNGSIFDYTTATTNKEESKVNLYFTSEYDQHRNGILATLKFRILDSAAGDAEFKLCYTPSDFKSTTKEQVEFESEDGIAVISCSHNHTETRNYKESTCTENGYTGDKYCFDCKKMIVTGAVVSANGHYWNDWQITVEPSFDSDGKKIRSCEICGEQETKVIERFTNAKVSENFVFGLHSGLTLEESEEYFTSDYADISIEPSQNNIIGTGSTVTALSSNGNSETLVVVLFGDVNGDGQYDGMDSVLVSCLADGMLTKDDVGEAVYKAADCNHDGTINSDDVELLGQAGLMQQDVVQFERTVVDSGECGDNLTWTLYDDGVLVIDGTGDMYNYDGDAPWGGYYNEITEVIIGDEVTSIGEYAFAWLNFSKITIGDSVTSIGVGAFEACWALESVFIPASVTNINDTFYMCENLKSITVSEDNEVYSSDEYGVLFNKDKTELVKFTIGNKNTHYTIPDSVERIKEYAFRDCYNLTSITIPDSVTSIGYGAFSGCTNLETVDYSGTAAEWNAITVGENNEDLLNAEIVFLGEEKPIIDYSDCGDNLTWTLYDDGELVISGTGVMTNYSTSSPAPWSVYSEDIRKIFVENGVTTIGNDTFTGCKNLEEVLLPDGITKIGDSAFRECVNLTEFIIPDTVKSIGHYAFYGCTGITEIELGSAVKTLGNHSFRMCTNLNSVTIPVSVTAINNNAFNECTALKTVVYQGTAEQWATVTVGTGNDLLLSKLSYSN